MEPLLELLAVAVEASGDRGAKESAARIRRGEDAIITPAEAVRAMVAAIRAMIRSPLLATASGPDDHDGMPSQVTISPFGRAGHAVYTKTEDYKED